jgi:hypothetical protein
MNAIEFIVAVFIVLLVIGFVAFLTFFKLDWTVGQHGRLTITAVDKNLFGTYTIYARNSDSAYTSEETEIKYCIDADNSELANFAKDNIGKPNSTLVYPNRRIGFYFWDKCRSAPIKHIIVQ